MTLGTGRYGFGGPVSVGHEWRAVSVKRRRLGYRRTRVSASGSPARWAGMGRAISRCMWARGLRARSLQARGLRTRSLQARGLRARGLRARGLRARSLQARGLQARGLRARGLRARSLQARGLRARGLLG